MRNRLVPKRMTLTFV